MRGSAVIRRMRAGGIGAESAQDNLGRAAGTTQMAARLAGLYALGATAWILLSDRILAAVIPDAGRLAEWQSFKGVFFVAVTTVLLAVMARRYLKRAEFESIARLQANATIKGLAREKESLQAALDAHAIVAITDPQGKITYANDQFCMISKYGREELIGQDHRMLNSGHHPQEFMRDLWATITQGRIWHGEIKNRAKDGSFYWVDASIVPLLDDHGKPVQYVSIRTDITERKRVEEVLRRNEELLREIVRVTGLGVFEHNHQTDVIHWSPEQRRHYGWTADEPVTLQDVVNCAHPDDRERIAAAVRQAHHTAGNGRYDVEHRILRRDGSAHWLLVRSQTYFEEDGGIRRPRLTVGAQLDITASKLAEEALDTERKLLRSLFDLLPDYIYIKDEQSRFIACSEQCARGMGAAASAEIIGRTDADFYPAELAAQYRADELLVLTGTPLINREELVVLPDGQKRHFLTSKLPRHDSTGRVIGIIGTGRDITDRKLLEEKFLRAQRMEAIGTLASGVAHDLNNILAPMLMAAGLLKSEMKSEEDRRILSLVETGAVRGAGIIRQLLTFSRGVEGARVSVQLRHVLKELDHLMQETFPKNIELVQSLPPDLWPVLADVTQLHQLFLNLCVNARDAMPTGGRLSIQAENLELDGTARLINPEARPGSYVVVTVTDTGEGIPPEIVDHIFEPFFTTKGIGKGSGLGLSTVLGVVKSHRGFVTVESEPGLRTQFRIHLPATTDAETPVNEGSSEQVPEGAGELVLVVDDEAAVREAMTHAMERKGYRVVCAGNGEEAIRLLIPSRGSVRLVLTDMMMPEMDGLTLIRTIRVIEPTIRIVACSGLEQEEMRASLAELGVNDFLPKPFAPAQLLKAVDRALHPA